MRPDNTLHVLVRSTLSPGLKMAQASHAVAEHCLRRGTWQNERIVICEADDVRFKHELEMCKIYRVEPVVWKEPDLHYQVTAFAIDGPDACKVSKKWKLAGAA